MTSPPPRFSALPDHQLLALLADDVPFGDLTTENLHLHAVPASAGFAARQGMRLSASEDAARLFELAGARCRHFLPSGTHLAPGQTFLEVEGPAGAILSAWKVAQTLVEYASGIATCAAAMVTALAAAGFDTPLACTRKHFPGTKAIAIRAVRAGGAVMHRLGLSDSVLVFPEHLALLAPEQQETALAGLRRTCPERKLVAEAATPEAALHLARIGVDVLQLEKFTPAALAHCLAELASRGLHPLLAAAGGVRLDNVVAYAAAGADVLVTSSPYFAPPADVQVHIRRCEG